ncbi:MAG: hypothetical protein K6G07_01085 [Lachnospiraceae bacterium]|nr:hypothetical protein [Lachnospiraceae bacterium]
MLGVGIGFCRVASLGVDPFACMILGLSGFFQSLGLSFMTYGTVTVVVNCLLFLVVWFNLRSSIGLGTIINMLFVGYVADFTVFLIGLAGLTFPIPMRVLFLIGGIFFITSGLGLYLEAEWGVAPYDTMAAIIQKWSKDRIKFQYGRIMSDFVCVVIGVCGCLLSGNSVFTVLGFGTVLCVCVNGPLIAFFRKLVRISKEKSS